MKRSRSVTVLRELQPLLELTQRVGSDPLLAQASTGNSSVKLDGVIWIKASGRWMADALRDDIFIPLDLAEVRECLRQGIDPAGRYPSASLETAMHAALPHRVVLHVHCVNTIAWAVRRDAPVQLRSRLDGLPWQWIPYVASGLPLARAIERSLLSHPNTTVFVLGNHGLVIAAENVESVEALLNDVRERVAIVPRAGGPADYAGLLEICEGSSWNLPDDDGLHRLGTDPVSQAILAGGLLYPCQAIFFGFPYSSGPVMTIKGRGIVVSSSIAPAELAMLFGLVGAVQRIGASAPLRYLTEAEVAGILSQGTSRYRELAIAHRAGVGR
jgi:rhamnose utilization protein RhaD (predicted bifunctional aldolase and dehydrogenase)